MGCFKPGGPKTAKEERMSADGSLEAGVKVAMRDVRRVLNGLLTVRCCILGGLNCYR